MMLPLEFTGHSPEVSHAFPACWRSWNLRQIESEPILPKLDVTTNVIGFDSQCSSPPEGQSLKGSIPVAKAELGVKRRCLDCNALFFDLGRTPIVCPKCRAVFQVVEIVRSAPRRSTIPATAIDRPVPVDPVVDDLVLPAVEEADQPSVLPLIEEDDEAEEVERLVDIERDDEPSRSDQSQ